MPHLHTAPGQVDHTVDVFIVYKNKVLIRKHDKYKLWLAVGGHIELNEDPNQAAIREVHEEVGLDVVLYAARKIVEFDQQNYKELIPPIFLNRHAITPTHDHVSYVYFATANSNQVNPENADDEWRWLTEAELQADKLGLNPNIKEYALAALRTLSSRV